MGQIFHSKIQIETGFYIILALSVLCIPLPWIIGWLVAVLVHEFFHYIALRLYKIPVFYIKLGACGADMSAGDMTTQQEIICALAGPFGSFVLLLLFRIFPYVALCAMGQLLFNFLPIYPLDGGRVLAGICTLLFGDAKGADLSKRISFIFIFILFCFSLQLTISFHLGIFPILAIVIILIRRIKIP